MRELSLNILDIISNSIRAEARNVELDVTAEDGRLYISIEDDGKGMSREFLAKVVDPFQTTRTTRKIGMGIPLLKQAAEAAGGSFNIESAPGKGTRVEASFVINHVDRNPLGDLSQALMPAISESFDLAMTYKVDGRTFRFDTKEIKEVLDGVPIDSHEMISYLAGFIKENIEKTNGGLVL